MQHAEVMLVGSANVDLVVRTHRFPLPGETVLGSTFQTFAGGKGANQATAVSKLGGKCGLIAKIGVDRFGDQLLESLRSSRVDISRVLRDADNPTGIAMITVDDAGQNTIVAAPGANALVLPEEVKLGLSTVEFNVLLTQLGIPLESVMAVSKHAEGKVFILNPAPARRIPDELLARVDYLTPNETEAQVLTGVLPVDDASCLEAAGLLLERGAKNILFTLGPKGSYLVNRHGGRHFPSIAVKAIDTTAAGDAFNGALAHFLANGEDVERAILLANVAGALCTTKPGAQAAMPKLSEVLTRFKDSY